MLNYQKMSCYENLPKDLQNIVKKYVDIPYLESLLNRVKENCMEL